MKKLLLLLFLCSVPLHAATYYVNGSGSQYVGTHGTYAIGSDATGTGSLAAPWASMTAAETAIAATGDTVYVAAATYSESWEPGKGTTWIADGTVVARRASGNYAVLVWGAATKSFTGFTFDGNAARAAALQLGAATRITTFTNCIFTGGTSYQIQSVINTAAPGVVFSACTMNIAAGQGGYTNGAGMTFTGGTITVSASGTRVWYCDTASTGGLVFTNNAVNITVAPYQVILLKGSGTVTISGNTFTLTADPVNVAIWNTAATTGTFTFSNNTVTSNTLSSNSLVYVGTGAIAIAIDNNYFSLSYSSTTDRDIIQIVDQPSPAITNNIAVSTPTGGVTFADVYSTGTDCGTVTIANNHITTASDEQWTIKVGTELSTAGDYKLNGAIVSGNSITMTAATGSLHAILVGRNINGQVHHNRIASAGGGIGVVLKGDGSASATYASGGAYTNVITGLAAQPCLYAKGMKAVPFYNNTCYVASSVSMGNNAMVWFGVNGTGENSTGGILKNNILSGKSNNLVLVDANSQTDFTSTNNLYYLSGAGNVGKVNTTTYAAIANWAAVYTGDIGTDPQFVSNGTDFRLKSSSPAINAGTSVGLAADFDSRPVTNTPDMGAYEFKPNIWRLLRHK